MSKSQIPDLELLLRLAQVQRTLVGQTAINMANTAQNSCRASALHLLAE